MATCPRCGYSRWLLPIQGCPVCGGAACSHCLSVYGSYVRPDGKTVHCKACSWECLDKWTRDRMSQGQVLVPWRQRWSLSGVVLDPMAARRALVIQAEHFVLAGRYEDAARSYENAGMWREAGEVRRRDRQHVVTQVHVDLNDLVEQLRRMGLSASYTCPVCRSPSRITGDTPPDALTKCQYCGTVIRSVDLVEAVTQVVGYR